MTDVELRPPAPPVKNICYYNGLQLDPTLILLDFEIAAHEAVRAVFPNTTIRGCRFHLGQSWWRKLQKKKNLVKAYRDEKSENGKWLHAFFGLSHLSSEEVPHALKEFEKDIPLDADYFEFYEYIRDTYVATKRFPPTLWAKAPTALDVATTNSAENFHSKLSDEFYHPHPPLFTVISFLIENQSLVHLKIDAAVQKKPAVKQNINTDRETFVLEQFELYSRQQISRQKFLRAMGHRFQPLK